MSFSENLRALRKQKGYSQEQLAEQLNVSRQAVSKWESDNGYPEMESLIIISELFVCSVDELLKSDLTNHDPDNKQAYEKHYNLMAKAYTFGTVSILLGVTFYLFTEIYFPANTKTEYIPQIILLFFVLIGVICFVYFGNMNSHFEKSKIELTDFYSDLERSEFNQKYSLSIAAGVGIILFSVVVQILIENIYNENLANGLFMLLITIAVGIFVYFGTLRSKYERVDEKVIEQEKQNKVASMWCGVIMMIATIVYLGWSFSTNSWQISWIVYPIGGIICGIIWLLFETKKDD